MSAEEQREADREIVRGLCAALEPVVREPLGGPALEAARNAAQLLLLPGLDRLLAAIEAHTDAAAAPEMRHAVERIGRERERGLAQSSLQHFHDVDAELAAVASHLETVEWSAPAGEAQAPQAAPREAVITLAGALGADRYADAPSEAAAAKTRLTAPVAAVLRAALDWLFGDAEQRAPLRITADAGVVELECRGVDPAGLLAAHEVIAGVGGALFPAPAGAGAWVLRLPAAAGRDVFLMLLQDDLRLALPWTNVLRIQLETASDQPLAAPPLAPLRPLTGARHGRPVVTVGLGLRRGALAADRLIWRLAGDPAPGEPGPPPGVTHAVRSDEGEIFWVVDVARLMRDVPLPPVEAREPAAPAERPEVAPPPAEPPAPLQLRLLTHESVEPIAGPPAAPAPEATPPAEDSGTADDAPHAPAKAEPARSEPALPARAGHAQPPPAGPARESHGGSPRAGSSWRFPGAPRSAAGAPAPAEHAAPMPAAAGGHAPRALVAEDSFMARIFLMRLLQLHGYDVHTVGTARELRGALSGESWSLVCVDVDLPDAGGAALVREVGESQNDRPEPAVIVALVRDGRDRDAAEAGGIHRVLLKPFAQVAVAAMLEGAGLPVRREPR